MENRVRLVFFGDVLKGQAQAEVRRKLQAIYRFDEHRLDQLFEGGRVVVKRSIGPDDARNHVKAFERAGAILCIETGDPPASARLASTRAGGSAQAPAATPTVRSATSTASSSSSATTASIEVVTQETTISLKAARADATTAAATTTPPMVEHLTPSRPVRRPPAPEVRPAASAAAEPARSAKAISDNWVKDSTKVAAPRWRRTGLAVLAITAMTLVVWQIEKLPR